MDQAEFDAFADEYHLTHARNISASGESPEFFHEYKVVDAAAAFAPSSNSARLQVLDFGCGVGNSLPYFRRHFPHSEIVGVDVSARSLEIANQRFPGLASLVEMPATGSLPFADRSFDLVFAACVLHHIPHEEHVRLLREWRRVLKPGGRALVFEHNPYNPLTVHAVNTCDFDKNAVLVKPHALAASLAAADLASVNCRYRIFFPGALRWLRSLERGMGWLPLGAQYCISARRAL